MESFSSKLVRGFGVALCLVMLTSCGLFGGKKNLTKGPDENASVPDADSGSEETSKPTFPTNSGSAGFLTACRTLAEQKGEVVQGLNGWLFSKAELGELAKGIDPATHASVVGAILDYQGQLKAAGIELIVAPVPPKAVIYPEQIGVRGSGRMDAAHYAVYKELSEKGVRIVDLAPALRRQRNQSGGMYPKTGSHWSPKGAQVAAERIFSTLKGQPWIGNIELDPNIVFQDGSIPFLGDLAGRLRGQAHAAPAAESLPIRVVGRRVGDMLRPLVLGKGGPVVLVGDRHCKVFGEPGQPSGFDGASRGSLADQLSYELGVPIGVHFHPTSGANTARIRLLRQSMSKPETLAKTGAVIWTFSATEMTSSNWRKVPLNLKLRRGEEGLTSG